MNTDIIRLKSAIPSLLAWYGANARRLPWRDNPTGYWVWISEIMLQQTRVEAVKPYFMRFVAALPTVEDLASVSEERLLKLWEGLGYYSRAKNLQKAAQRIVAEYGGNMPSNYQALLSLPGIGEYTAGAIASIAFGQPVPAVDGNVLRVMARILSREDDIASLQTKRIFREILTPCMPQQRPGDLNQSLMELGATVCIPNGAPLCIQCPAAPFCLARQMNTVHLLPVKAPKKPRAIEKRLVFLLISQGKVVLSKRQDKGLLHGMWEFPNALEGDLSSLLISWDIQPNDAVLIGTAKHIFTHKEWHMTGYLVKKESIKLQPHWRLVTLEELDQEYALPSAFSFYRQKAVEALEKSV